MPLCSPRLRQLQSPSSPGLPSSSMQLGVHGVQPSAAESESSMIPLSTRATQASSRSRLPTQGCSRPELRTTANTTSNHLPACGWFNLSLDQVAGPTSLRNIGTSKLASCYWTDAFYSLSIILTLNPLNPINLHHWKLRRLPYTVHI